MHSGINGVYAITPDVGPLWSQDALLDASEALLAAGVQWLQCRQKQMSPMQRLDFAVQLGQLCEKYGAGLMLNDAQPDTPWYDIPGLVGVHVGKGDWPVQQAREALPADLWVGASCYNELERAVNAVQAGASHVAFGAMYPSGTKPLAVRAPLALLTQAQRLQVPVVAIGGIDLIHLPELAKAGANAVAVVSALFGAQAPSSVEAVQQRAAQWIQLWNECSLCNGDSGEQSQ